VRELLFSNFFLYFNLLNNKELQKDPFFNLKSVTFNIKGKEKHSSEQTRQSNNFFLQKAISPNLSWKPAHLASKIDGPVVPPSTYRLPNCAKLSSAFFPMILIILSL
jgi:hypothetical protein